MAGVHAEDVRMLSEVRRHSRAIESLTVISEDACGILRLWTDMVTS